MLKPALGVQFRCQYPPELLQAYARTAESSGLDELWIVEDCFWGGGIASVTAALSATAKITVGLGIMPAVARNAAFTAMELSTISRLFPGRLVAGFGHGVADWMHQVGAFPSSQLAALGETTEAVRALLRGETFSAGGTHVRLREVKIDLPPHSVPPIVLGVRGPKSLALAGRVADGTILAEGASAAYVAWAREQIERDRTTANRVDSHRLTVYTWCSVDGDGAAARAKLRPLVAGALLSPEAHTLIAPLGIADDVRALSTLSGDAFAAEMPDAWLSQLAVCGTPDECVAGIERLYAAGADAVVLTPLIDDNPLTQLMTLAQELRPRLHRNR